MANSLYACPLPRLPAIRRVPVCYHHILPLPLVKHLQCVVVGAARGVLTVAIANTQHVETIAPLEKITGQRIFAVLVDEGLPMQVAKPPGYTPPRPESITGMVKTINLRSNHVDCCCK